MRGLRITAAVLALTATAAAAPMTEVKGLRANEGCSQPSTVATEKLRTCPIDATRSRIWCPNGKVFDRDTTELGVAILRSVCEMNQLPPG